MRKHLLHNVFCLSVFVVGFLPAAVHAVDMQPQQRLQACMKKAEDVPDMAVADAESWFKKGGGDNALLCRATALFHRGEFGQAGRDFSVLATHEKDAHKSSLLYVQAGRAFQSAQDYPKSDSAYGVALKLEAQDPDIWVDRATERAAAQKYWDAVNDLNKALAIMPDMPEALRLRGQVWYKLGMEHNAEDDFGHSAEIQAQDDVAKSKTRPVAATKPTP